MAKLGRGNQQGELITGDAAVSQNRSASTEVAVSRAAQEVQAAMIMAKKFPRDELAARARISQACKRPKLAEESTYSYPRGTTKVEGPSIRLAEVLAQNWGNMDFGIVELEQTSEGSQVMAFAWDLETNTRETKTFSVSHLRHTKSGSYALTDPRDIYENVANQGARRLRACILGIIPGDVCDDAVEECNKTLKGANKDPLNQRIEKMVVAFAAYGVTSDMIKDRFKHTLETISETELVSLRKIYNSIKDNMAPVSEFFGNSVTTTKTERTEKPAEPMSFLERIEKAKTPDELDKVLSDADDGMTAGTFSAEDMPGLREQVAEAKLRLAK